MNETDALAFVVANDLGFEYSEGRYVVRNVRSIGLVAPRRCSGQGSTLAEALKEYMAVLVNERGDRKPPLVAYVAEKDADADVVAAVAADTKMPAKPEPPSEEETTKGV